jgi:hypothetical protein
MKRMAAIVGIMAVGAIGGLLSQASGAQASNPTSDKTLYAGSNYNFGTADAPANGPATTVLRIRVSAPSAGTAVVNLDSQVWAQFPGNASSNPLYAEATVGRCSATNTLSSSVCNAVQTIYFQKAPYDNTSSNITEPYSLSALIPFSHGGTKTLSLNVQASGYASGFYGSAHTQVGFTPSHPINTSSHVSLHVFE